MSVTIEYVGESGSHLSQYICARLFAQKYGFNLYTTLGDTEVVDRRGNRLRTDKLVGVIYDMKPVGVQEERCSLTEVNDDNFISLFKATEHQNRRWHFHGNFADSQFFESHRAEIEKFIVLDDTPPNDPEDIGIHVRATAYGWTFGGSRIIDSSWYKDILGSISWRHGYLHTDEPGHPVVRALLDFYPGTMKLVPTELGARHAFNSLASFDRVLAGNSTFSFWSTFLGRASKSESGRAWTLKEQLGEGHGSHQLGRYRNSIEVSGRYWQP